MKFPVVAIDGPAGSGKSTVAKKVAERLGFKYIDSGAMYRAVTYAAMKEGLDLNDENALAEMVEKADIQLEKSDKGLRVLYNNTDVTDFIRSAEVSRNTSPVADCIAVRRRLVDMQREYAESSGVVMDGRDIGTEVFPDARYKIYLDADAEERARRRLSDLEASGETADLQKVLADVRERDRRDSSRPVGALRKAENAVIIDSTNMNIDEVAEAIIKIVEENN